MRYEIRSVDPILGDRDVLVELWHWHGDAPVANRPPDFIEHVRVCSIPGPRSHVRRNNMDQPIRADGVLDWPFRETVDGWMPWEPLEGDPDYQWDVEDDRAAELIVSVAEARSREVRARRLRGRDVFPASEPQRIVNRPGHVAKRGDVRGLNRRRGQVPDAD